MRQVPNLNWLKSFDASARHLSFTEAARELNMTQAGISQHVRLLEFSLQQPLFHRLPRGLELTDAGEAYLHVVRESFERLVSGTAEIFGEDGRNLVTIRTNVAFATHWLATRLSSFRAQRPDISLRLLAAVHGSDTVWDGVDFEIRYGGIHANGLSAIPVMPDRLFPVCHPSLAADLKRPEDLLEAPLLHVIGNSHGWTEWLRVAGIRVADAPVFMQTDTSAIALELAANGVGVALGHSSLVSHMLARGSLVQLFDVAIETSGVFHLIMPSDRKLRPEAEAFRQWLRREAGTFAKESGPRRKT
jgi:LysR family glycine cleavage system transcriptional activator